MAIKRSSWVCVDETSRHHDAHRRQMASAYISRQTSRNSLKDEPAQAVDDIEAGQMSRIVSWEPQATSSSSHSLAPDSTEAPLINTSGNKILDKSSGATSPFSSVISDPPDHASPAAANKNPTNFGLVAPGVYRSSYPKPEDHDFLRGLKLKTVVTLVKREDPDHDLLSFVKANGINQVVFDMKGTKKEAIPTSTMRAILELVLDRSNYPLLVHCNHGKHRTGCVVGAMRKLSGWHVKMVVDEYKTYAEPKVRECDVDYINDFQCAPLQSLYKLHGRTGLFSPMQVRAFFRALLFSTFVMVLWLVSGSQMPPIDGMASH